MSITAILKMNDGNDECSYPANTTLLRSIIMKAKPVVFDTIRNMWESSIPERLRIADLGCSCGPNCLLVVSEILEIVYNLCKENNKRTPQIEVALNDLPGNDFNNVFVSLPHFYDSIVKGKGEKFKPFIFGVPGSFFGRLFPDKTIHFVHSSYSVHWLSQVPKNLAGNKENIYITKTSLPEVFEAYRKQFQTDFSKFLSLRAKEIVLGGRMVLTVAGRKIIDLIDNDNHSCIWEPLTKSLLDLVTQGLVSKQDVESFNISTYFPHKDELKDIIEEEGSFRLDRLEVFEVDWDASNDNDEEAIDFQKRGENVAKTMRAASEPILSAHFGKSIMDSLFQKYAIHAVEHLAMEKSKFFSIVMSLSMK